MAATVVPHATRELFNEIIAPYIEVFAQGKEHLNTKFQAVVNA